MDDDYIKYKKDWKYYKNKYDNCKEEYDDLRKKYRNVYFEKSLPTLTMIFNTDACSEALTWTG